MAGGENHPNHSGRTLGVLVSFIAVALLISPYHAQNTTSIFNTLYCAVGLTSVVPCESSTASPITQTTSAKGESKVLSEQTSRNTSVSLATTTHITNVYNNTYPVTVLYKPDDVPLSYTPADVYLTATPVPLTPLELFKKQVESMQDDFGDRVRNAVDNLEEDIADSVDTDSLSTDELTVNGTLSTTGGVTFTSLGGGILQTDALGNLSTTSISAGSISDDSLDFVQFRDALTLDASTDIAVSGSNVLSVTNSGTGNSFVVNDEIGDTSPFTVTADGRVGIGTTTPSRSLHVVGNGIISERTAGSPQLVMRNLFGGVYQEWQLHVGNTGDLSFRDTTSGSADVFQIRSGAPSASFYLDSTGNLGLGDTTADYKLEVVGTLGVSSSATGDGDRFMVNSSGNVGIGTTTPSHTLTVAGDQLNTGYLSVAHNVPENTTMGDITASRLFLGNYPAITTNVVAPLQVVGNSAATSQILSARYSDDTFPPGFQSAKARGTASAPAPVIIGDALYSLTGYGYASSGVFAQGSFIISVVDKTPTATAVPTALTFNVASSTTPLEAMRISSARFVGIGYTNPSAKLHVVNTESVPSFLVEDTTVTDSTPFVIDENGAVGIGVGTVTRGKMEVIQATDGISGGIAVVNSGITGSMRMWVNSSGNAVIDNGTASGDLLLNPTNMGEVGIGTTTPSQLLTVAGNARITGALYDSTNSAGTSGYVLQSTGTGQQWVATSSLGFGTGSVAGTGSADRVAFWSGASSLSSDATFTFANSMLTAPTFNASGASTTVLSVNNVPFLQESTTQQSVSLGYGANALLGAGNIAIGEYALNQATTSDANYNTALGITALEFLTTGDSNTALGAYALQLNATGSENVAIGYLAGNQILTSGNTAIGFNALGNAWDYSARNTAIGYRAGYNVQSGFNNILLGYQAGESLQSGSYNIVIGNDIELQDSDWSNRLNIGNLLFGTGIDGTGTTLSTGNIGIGTTTPSEKLHVAGGNILLDNGRKLQWLNSVGTVDAGVYMDTTNSIVFEGGAGGAMSGYIFKNNNGSSTLMTVLNSGNVGIGTTTPDEKLTVNGNVRLNVGSSGMGIFGRDLSDNNLFSLTRESNDTSLTSFEGIGFASGVTTGPSSAYDMFITSGGNVGIGTTDPTATLAINNASSWSNLRLCANTTGCTVGDGFEFSVDGDGGTQGDAFVWNYENRYIQFGTNNIARMTIAGGGNIGIGTDAPDDLLHLLGASAGAVTLKVQNTNSSGDSELLLSTSGSSTSTTVGSSLVADRTDVGGAGSTDMVFNTSLATTLTERMRILADGNVGIGTTTPNAKLEVSGSGSGLALELNNAGTGDGLRINTADASANNGLLWYQGNDNLFNVYSNASNEGFMTLYDAGVTAVQLASNGSSYFTGGNVAIGTSTPQATLHVESASVSSLRIQSALASATVFDMYQGGTNYWRQRHYESGSASSPNALGFGYNQTNPNMFLIESTGDIGLGTNDPQGDLHVRRSGVVDVIIGSTNASGALLTLDGFANGDGSGGDYAFLRHSSAGLLEMTNLTGDIQISGTGGSCTFTGAVSGGTCFSDERLKQVSGEVSATLEGLSTLKLKTFYWNDRAHEVTNASTTIENTGFIAQEVAEVFPELVYTNKDGYKTLDYSTLTLYGIVAIQELNERTRFLENASSSALLINSDSEIFWERLGRLVEGFADGVLTLAGVTTNELCLKDENGSTCIDREELNALMRERDVSDNSQSGNDVPLEENNEDEVSPIASSTPETASSSVPVIETDPVDEIVIDVPKTEEDVTEVAEEEVEEVVEEEDAESEEPEEEVVESTPVAVGE